MRFCKNKVKQQDLKNCKIQKVNLKFLKASRKRFAIKYRTKPTKGNKFKD